METILRLYSINQKEHRPKSNTYRAKLAQPLPFFYVPSNQGKTVLANPKGFSRDVTVLSRYIVW